MKTPRKIALILVVTLIIGVGVCAMILLRQPPVPAEWQKVHVGMSRDELHRMIPDEIDDARDIKGGEFAFRECDIPLRSCRWWLAVVYTNDDRVKFVAIEFQDRNCGWFTKTAVCEGSH